ncbi:MAG: flavocytochrome c [Desulfovibrio sp.]|jgi:fumarate reductase flavoprotein subunit|nr:flavocytochrome c [Desulfovibrio sp.]
MSKKVARRSFLKGAAIGAAAIASSLAMDLGGARNAVAAAKARALPTKWDETFDVVIIGSGFAGFAAGAEAAKAGAKTIILEKMQTYGGNSIINGGLYAAWDSELHLREKLKYGTDSAALHTKDTILGGDEFPIPELAKILAEGAPDALNWMINEGGCKLKPVLAKAGGHSAYRTHVCEEYNGRGYVEPLHKIALKYGCPEPRLQTEVTWIWRALEGGPVLGVEVKSGGGGRGAGKVSNIKVNRALVLASGGFSRDTKMRTDHYPYLKDSFLSTNQKGATGEIIRFAQNIGADTLQMNFIQLYPYAEPESGVLDEAGLYPFNGPGVGVVYVAKNGKRFVSEQERRDVVSFAQLKLGDANKPTYSIFNLEMLQKIGAEQKKLDDFVAKKRIVVADTIGGVADQLKINKAALEETIKKHIEYIKIGKDPEFNKPITPQMVTLEKGPYYGVPQWPAIHHTMGGLRFTPKGQVVDVFGEIIPKLYAAGEICGGVHGSNRLGSNAIPDAIVFGRVAGRNAAAEKA